MLATNYSLYKFIYKQDLALYNLQELICHKIEPKKLIACINVFVFCFFCLFFFLTPTRFIFPSIFIETLRNYRGAVKKRHISETDLVEQQRSMDTPEMKMKLKECSEAEERLRAIEQKLGKY